MSDENFSDSEEDNYSVNEEEEEDEDPVQEEDDIDKDIIEEIEIEDENYTLSELKEQEDNKKFKKFKTSNYMTKYEYARLIGTRAIQISQGAPIFINVNELRKTLKQENVSPIQIAKQELAEKKFPLGVSRPLPSKHLDRPIMETRYISTLNY